MHIEKISSIFVYSNTFKEMLFENVQMLSEKCKCQCRINIELRFLSRGWFWMLVQISWVIQHFAILKRGVFCSITIVRSSGNLTSWKFDDYRTFELRRKEAVVFKNCEIQTKSSPLSFNSKSMNYEFSFNKKLAIGENAPFDNFCEIGP